MTKPSRRYRVPPADRLTCAFTVRFTEKEAAEVRRRSQKLAPAAWVREQLLSLMVVP